MTTSRTMKITARHSRRALTSLAMLAACDLVFASSSDLVAIAAAQTLTLPTSSDQPLPAEIVWMPAGEHEISAHGADGKVWNGKVVCDEAGARAVQAALAQVLAAGRRVYLDKNHDDGEATAWVTAFRWDPALGIIAKVEWTSLGEQLLRGKVYYSFSPAFLVNKSTGRVSGFPLGHAAGGLVNAPAFGAAMPALIAARLAGAEPSATAAPDGSSGNPPTATMKDILIKLLQKLGVQIPDNATEEQLLQLAEAALGKTNENAEEAAALKAQLGELQTLKAAEAARRKKDAKSAVDAAIARGALPPKDEKVHAKWLGLIQADPSHAELLAALPSSPALHRVTQPGGIVVQARDGLLESLRQMEQIHVGDSAARAMVWAKDIAPLFAKHANFGRELGLVLASNSLGALEGELVLQRALSLLKLEYPFLFAISTDFSAENGAFDQTVKTRLKGALTAQEYDPSTGYTDSDATTTDVPVKIDEHWGVSVSFNANELSGTNRDLFGEQAEGLQSALADKVIATLYALITAGNFTHYTTSTVAGFKRKTFTTIARKLGQRKVPAAGRFALLSPEFFEQASDDTSVVALATQQRADLITEYKLPPIAGFQPWEAVNLPTTGDLAGFFGTARALALATRVPNDYTQVLAGVPSVGLVQNITNPETGITVQLVRFVNHSLARATARAALMWGAAVGDPACGERLVETEGGDESS